MYDPEFDTYIIDRRYRKGFLIDYRYKVIAIATNIEMTTWKFLEAYEQNLVDILSLMEASGTSQISYYLSKFNHYWSSIPESWLQDSEMD